MGFNTCSASCQGRHANGPYGDPETTVITLVAPKGPHKGLSLLADRVLPKSRGEEIAEERTKASNSAIYFLDRTGCAIAGVTLHPREIVSESLENLRYGFAEAINDAISEERSHWM